MVSFTIPTVHALLDTDRTSAGTGSLWLRYPPPHDRHFLDPPVLAFYGRLGQL